MPPFVFTRSLYLLCDSCCWDQCYGDYNLAPQEFHDMSFWMIFDATVLLIAAIYLNQVVPQEFGVPKHPLFLFDNLIRQSPSLHKYIFGDDKHLKIFKDEIELEDEDQDVRTERELVYETPYTHYKDYPLIVKDIRKVYPGVNGRPPKCANKNMCLKIKNGELFGLLGPNGAGKTTLISQLTGLYPPTLGNAWVGGYDIKNQLDIVQLQIGVCPQFDILWD